MLNGFEVLNEFCPEDSLSVPNLPSLATTFAVTPAALTNCSLFCSRVTVAMMHINEIDLQEEESMGITKLMRTGMTIRGDSVLNIQGSLPARTISAIPSAEDQMIPKGPAYPGPICCCISANTLHLSRTMTKTPTVTPMANERIEARILIDSKGQY